MNIFHKIVVDFIYRELKKGIYKLNNLKEAPQSWTPLSAMDVGIYSLTFHLSLHYAMISFHVSENGKTRHLSTEVTHAFDAFSLLREPFFRHWSRKAVFHYFLPSHGVHFHNSSRSAMEVM